MFGLDFWLILGYGLANLLVGWYVGKKGISATVTQIQTDVSDLKAKVSPSAPTTTPAVG